MPKEESCGINTGPLQLSAGDKIKIVAKRIQGGGPTDSDANQVRVKIKKIME